MDLPRLKPSAKAPPEKHSTYSTRKKVAAKYANTATKNTKAILNNENLAREAEILSLLTVLNSSVMNEDLADTLQAVKAALFERDYATAFSRPDYLRAYCARWVPGRALAYRDLLLDCEPIVELCQRRAAEEPLQTICIGGGAGSDVIAFAAMVKELAPKSSMHVTTLDSADWGDLLVDMDGLIKSRWDIDTARFSTSFEHRDILDSYLAMDFAGTDIITLLFTTNELFASSKPKTLALISHLSTTCRSGTLLLVAESAGSYSEISVGDKTYPLQLILDQKLAGRDGAWRAVKKEEGRWYRVPEESKKRYQLQLENTHMLVRLYSKI